MFCGLSGDGGLLPRRIWTEFDPISPDEILRDVLTQQGDGWIVDEWDALMLSGREGAPEIIADAKIALLDACRTGRLKLYACPGDEMLYLVPAIFVEKNASRLFAGTLDWLMHKRADEARRRESRARPERCRRVDAWTKLGCSFAIQHT